MKHTKHIEAKAEVYRKAMENDAITGFQGLLLLQLLSIEEALDTLVDKMR